MGHLGLAAGHSVGYMTREVATAREGYYTGAVVAGEPAGVWYGAGAEALGLSGEVDADLMEAIYSELKDPRDLDGERLAPGHRNYKSAEERYQEALAQQPHAGPERREKLWREAEKSARGAIKFEDATFSPVKSVTVLGVSMEWAANEARAAGDVEAAEAWEAMHRGLEAAVMTAARSTIDYLQDTSGYGRTGDHSGKTGRWKDSHRWVVAQFLQHDSRARDPQLHVHQAILNLQQDNDGRWWRLDTMAMRQQHHAAGAVGARVLEAELTRLFGLQWYTREDGVREIDGVPQQVMDLFSSRRRAISPRIAELVREYAEQTGREPSLLERQQIAQRATLETRAKKSHDGETNEQRLARWERQTREEFAGGLAQVARAVLDASPAAAGERETFSDEDVIDRALAAVEDGRGTWLRADLIEKIDEALPANLGMPAGEVRVLLEGLADKAIDRVERGGVIRMTPVVDTAAMPADLLLDNGDTSYSRPGQVYYTTPTQVAGERYLLNTAIARGATAFTKEAAVEVLDGYTANGIKLATKQAAAVYGVLTSSAWLESIYAPAGTGKSFTVGAIARAWSESGRTVHGLAPSQVAAQVLAEDDVAAWNTTRWLNAQHRGTRGPDDPPPLDAGDLVVVDEAGMATTRDLVAVVEYARRCGAKVLFVGDDRQLSPVGPGGAFAHVAEEGIRYELDEVRRFSAQWERDASLRLRDGDPDVLAEYDKAGRIVDGGTAEQAAAEAARRWLADTVQGRESLLIVGTNEQAGEVSGQLRAELVRLGRVAEDGVQLARDGNVAGIGDIVQARHNEWALRGWEENTRVPINRETYRVTGHRADGGLVVEHLSSGTRVELPADYVTVHLQLAYASTAHGAQGRTVDTSHDVVGSGTSAEGLYVPLTRGRDCNTVYVVTQQTRKDEAAGTALDVEARTPIAVLSDILGRESGTMSAIATWEALEDDAASTATLLERLAVEASKLTRSRTSDLLDAAAATGAITDVQRIAIAADPASGMLDRLLRQAEVAGHDPATVLARALDGHLNGVTAPAAVLYHRIEKVTDLSGHIESAHQLIPRGLTDEKYSAHFARIADAADDRRRELGQRVADEAPEWAVAALGAVPDDPIARAEWEHSAGWAATSRELTGHDDNTDALGPCPPAPLVEKHALWRAAHVELGLPDCTADDRELSIGQHRIRIAAAARERKWAPTWVADQLAATAERLGKVKADAALWLTRAREETGQSDEGRAQFTAAAEQAQREAAELEVKVAQLRIADDERAAWAEHAAATLDEGERSYAEVAARGIDLAGERKVTGEEWVAEHRAAMRAEDPHRVVTVGDLDETPADADRTLAEGDLGRDEQVAETDVPDVREISTPADTEFAGDDEDATSRRVPTDDEVTESVERAHASLVERRNRAAYDDGRGDDRRDDGPTLEQWADEHDDAQADVDESVGV